MFKTQASSKKLTFSDQLTKAIKENEASKTKKTPLAKKIVEESDSSSEDEEIPESKEQKIVSEYKDYKNRQEIVKEYQAKKEDSKAVKSRTKLSDLSDEDKVLRHKEQMKEWREQHPDYNKTYRQKYYAENRDKILEKRRMKRQEEKKALEEFKAYKSSMQQK
jgi:hypothetical protein